MGQPEQQLCNEVAHANAMYAGFLLDGIKFIAGQKAFCNAKSWEITKCATIPYGCGVPWVLLVLCQDPSLFSRGLQALSAQFAGSSLLLLAVSPSIPNLPSPPQRNVVLQHCLIWLTPSLSSHFLGMPAVFQLFYTFRDVSILHHISWLASSPSNWFNFLLIRGCH